jgi:hypothetical protein
VKYANAYASSLPNPSTPVWTSSETYLHSYDTMARLSQLQGMYSGLIAAKDAAYNAAGQMTALKCWYGTVSGTGQFRRVASCLSTHHTLWR